MKRFRWIDDEPTISQNRSLFDALDARQQRLVREWLKKKRRIERRRQYKEWFRTLLVRPNLTRLTSRDSNTGK